MVRNGFAASQDLLALIFPGALVKTPVQIGCLERLPEPYTSMPRDLDPGPEEAARPWSLPRDDSKGPREPEATSGGGRY
jgi:hypothetical protein